MEKLAWHYLSHCIRKFVNKILAVQVETVKVLLLGYLVLYGISLSGGQPGVQYGAKI